MIKVLPKDVADKIAAGEVIESPVSIVKELIENSIDAGATSITCEITRGGKEEIRITDNGIGIPSAEVETAFLRHATSKIAKAEDLKCLETLGFRGEALASISAVSRTELITRNIDEEIGTRIIIHGGSTISKESIGCPVGTTIIVKDLFYNMPARAKFMKSEGAEAGKVVDMMSRLAITKPDIHFSFISNGKNYFSTSGNNDLRAAIIAVFKERDYSDLVPVNYSTSDESIHVYGYISRPSISRTNRRSQYFFVNGRAVKSNVLEKGVNLGYKERLFEGRYPIVFLFIDIDAARLDVNVHPNKREVRFFDEVSVVTSVETAIKETLTSNLGVIKAVDSFGRDNSENNKSPENNKSVNNAASGNEKSKAKNTETQIDIKQILSSARETSNLNQAAKSPETYSHDEKPTSGDYAGNASDTFEDKSFGSYDFGTPDMEAPGLKPFDFDDLTFNGAIFGTYILASDSENLYLFDQHAAHERINYERFINTYFAEDKQSQILLTPYTFDIPSEMIEAEGEWLDVLNRMGYSVESFGDNTFIVREIPLFMTLSESEDFVHSFVDSYNYDLKTKNQVVIDKLITKSCKASIKAHDYIKDEEISALISQLKMCNNPFSCPHGRPTFIKFSLHDIEHMFKRIN